jgi:RNA polymerase sigma factor (sigma-70 family)
MRIHVGRMPDTIGEETVAARAVGRWGNTRAVDDASLVARTRAGDDAAFEVVFDRYHRNLFAFCHHMLGSREDAEDALQQIFMAAHRGLRSGDRPVHLRAWLYTIARNRCVSVLRTRRQHVALERAAPATEGLIAEVDRRAELQTLIRDLGRLPDDQRAALVLWELGDHSHDEIASVLAIRREKVKALIFQARESLMGWRTARETPCWEIRQQIAIVPGAASRGGPLRRHVEQCAGCAEYAIEVRHQRAALAAVLPVVPASGLKSSVLASTVGGSSAGVAAGGGAAMSASGVAVVAIKGTATKILAAIAVAGGAGGTGYVAVDRLELGDAQQPLQAQLASPSVASARVDADRARTVAGATVTMRGPTAPSSAQGGATAPAALGSTVSPDSPAATSGSGTVAEAPGDATAPPTDGGSNAKAMDEPETTTTDGANGEAARGTNGEATDGANGKATDGASGKATDGANGKATDGANGKATDGANGKASEGATGKAAPERSSGSKGKEADKAVGNQSGETEAARRRPPHAGGAPPTFAPGATVSEQATGHATEPPANVPSTTQTGTTQTDSSAEAQPDGDPASP